jgi:hypothetical protein
MAMDRISQLADDLSVLLDQLHQEAAGTGLRPLMAPLAWLDEANAWLRYELEQLPEPSRKEPVAFTYIPVSLRK